MSVIYTSSASAMMLMACNMGAELADQSDRLKRLGDMYFAKATKTMGVGYHTKYKWAGYLLDIAKLPCMASYFERQLD
jgi:hypothetical protein